MLRVMGTMLLAGASVAHAGEHYREVWNPPEAKQALHARPQAHHRPAACRLAAKQPMKAKPSHVATSVPKSTNRRHVGRTVAVHTFPHVVDRSPQSTPEGNVLRVEAHGARPEVAR